LPMEGFPRLLASDRSCTACRDLESNAEVLVPAIFTLT
jgi:hypothetical protein